MRTLYAEIEQMFESRLAVVSRLWRWRFSHLNHRTDSVVEVRGAPATSLEATTQGDLAG